MNNSEIISIKKLEKNHVTNQDVAHKSNKKNFSELRLITETISV